MEATLLKLRHMSMSNFLTLVHQSLFQKTGVFERVWPPHKSFKSRL